MAAAEPLAKELLLALARSKLGRLSTISGTLCQQAWLFAGVQGMCSAVTHSRVRRDIDRLLDLLGLPVGSSSVAKQRSEPPVHFDILRAMRDHRAVAQNTASEISRLRVNMLEQIRETQTAINPPPVLPLSAYAEYGVPTAPGPGGAAPTQADITNMAASVTQREMNKMVMFVNDARFTEAPIGSFGTRPVMAPRPPRTPPANAQPGTLATWPPLLGIHVVTTIDHFALVSTCTTILMSMAENPDQVLDPRVTESALSSILASKWAAHVTEARDTAVLALFEEDDGEFHINSLPNNHPNGTVGLITVTSDDFDRSTPAWKLVEDVALGTSYASIGLMGPDG